MEYRSVIAFGDHERVIGDSAVAQIRSNFKNTLQYVNRYLGLNSECKEQIEEETKYIINKMSFSPDKKVLFSVTNKGESLDLVPEQVYGAYLKKLKKLFTHEDENVDVVLSVPPYFTTVERQAVLDACKIAKVNWIRLFNENTATSLAYGFFRRQEFNETPKNVCFLDIGHGKTTCTVSSFTNTKVNILSHASNRNLGGRNFDNLILDILGGEFTKKYGCDPRKVPKCRLRMLDSIEKTRKILSANSEAAVNIESLLEDNDLHRNITRDELEQLVQPWVDEIKRVWELALKECNLKDTDIDRVELVGEATRMPIIKKVIEDIFKKDTSYRTLNSQECVARGCSLMAAMILPQYHVAKFEIQECSSYAIDVSWSNVNNDMKTKTLFPKYSNFPSVKSLTFDGRSEPMDVGVSYHDMEGVVVGQPQLQARYRIEPPAPKEEKFSLKLRVQVDQNWIPSLDTAELIEEYIEIKKVAVKTQNSAPAPAPTPTEENKDGTPQPEATAAPVPEQTFEEKEIKKTRSTEIKFKFEHHGYSAKQLSDFIRAEDEMWKQDNVILDLKIMRNHLETYVYDMRAALDIIGNLKEYIKEQDRTEYLELLNQTEQWIYDDGESATKDVYKSKLEHLQKIGEAIKLRSRFHESFKPRAKEFQNVITSTHQKVLEIPGDSHITAEEKSELLKSCEENSSWLSEALSAQESQAHYENPVVDLVDLDQKRHKLIELANKILNKPAPAKEVKKEEAKSEGANQEAPKDSADSNGDAEMKDA